MVVGDEAFAQAAWPGAPLLLFLGLSAQQPCPQGSSDCQKQCEPDYYLGGSGGCLACVSCSKGKDLTLPSGASSREGG